MLYVEDMRGVDAATWDGLLLQSPGGGHVLQTYAWGEFKTTRGWTPLRLALKEGDRVVGVGQVLLRQPPGIPGVVAYCPKGPWLDWANGAHVRTMLQGMEHLVRRRGACIVKIESELPSGPGQPTSAPLSIEEPLHCLITGVRRLRGVARADDQAGPAEEGDDARVAEARAAILAARAAQACDGQTPGRVAFTELGYVKSHWDMQFRTTMVVDLDRPPEAMLARMKSKWRYNVNLAQRRGVTVEQDDSPGARRRLYAMYERTARRQGFVLRHRSYFLDAWDAMVEAGYAHLFFACHGGRPLAALLAHTFGPKVWYHVGASEDEGRNVMPAHALQFHVMPWAQQRGMTCYDLVAIPNAETMSTHDSMWNLYVFKSGFGGVRWSGWAVSTRCSTPAAMRGKPSSRRIIACTDGAWETSCIKEAYLNRS